MSLAHVHLLLNHFPIVGAILGLAMLASGMLWKSSDLVRTSLAVLVGIALLTIPAYVTGNAAREEICKAPPGSPPSECPEPYAGVSEAIAEAHESAAFPAMGLMQLTGALAWLGLWQLRRFARLPGWTAPATLMCGVITLGLMTKAALLGGQIRHPELRDAQDAAAGAATFARTFGAWIVNTSWAWPTLETVHFLGLSLLFGVTLLVDLRVLGLMKTLSFYMVHRLLPWGILGFALNAATGMLFFVATPQQYDQSLLFYLKLLLIMVAGVNVLYFTVFEQAWVVGPKEDAPFVAKAIAAATLILVVAVLYCGRMLPFLGTSF